MEGGAPPEALPPAQPYAWVPPRPEPQPRTDSGSASRPRRRPPTRSPRQEAQTAPSEEPPISTPPDPAPQESPTAPQTTPPPEPVQVSIADALPSTSLSASQQDDGSVGEPGTWESLIPIWGSGRAAINHFQHGNYWRGAAYTALAISDVFLVKSLVVAGGRLLVRGGASLMVRETEAIVAREGGEQIMETAASVTLREADDLVARAASGTGEVIQHAPRFGPGVQVTRLSDDWFVKSISQEAGKFGQRWGAMSVEAQHQAFLRLGSDMAPEFFIRNNMLFTRSVGATGPSIIRGTFWRGFGRGSFRMRTLLNDIKPRNMGINGLIFDPALDPLMRSGIWMSFYGMQAGPGFRQSEMMLNAEVSF